MKTAEPPMGTFTSRRPELPRPVASPAPDSEAVRARRVDSKSRINQSIHYMMDHLDQPLQVAKLAALENVSASHYFALFKSRTGRSPIDFFIRLRMRRACELLRETSLSIKEIAAELGYDDPFYFSRIFKSVNQVAPREYRVNGGAPDGMQMVPLPRTSVQFEQAS